MKKLIDINNTLTISKVVDSISSDDLDFDMYDDIFGNLEDVNQIDNSKHEYYPIKLDKLKSIIKRLEKQGCNYVSISYNCDHPDYTFVGVNVHQSTQDEVDSFKEKQDKSEKLKTEFQLLEKRKKEILNEYNKLK